MATNFNDQHGVTLWQQNFWFCNHSVAAAAAGKWLCNILIESVIQLVCKLSQMTSRDIGEFQFWIEMKFVFVDNCLISLNLDKSLFMMNIKGECRTVGNKTIAEEKYQVSIVFVCPKQNQYHNMESEAMLLLAQLFQDCCCCCCYCYCCGCGC